MNRLSWMGLSLVAALAVAIIGGQGLATAQTKSDTPPASVSGAGAPEKIEGTVTAVDAGTGTVTLKGSDGQTHSFRGDAETLKDLKVGDRVTLNKRGQPTQR